MRSSVKVLSVAAALARAVGLSACDEQDIAQPSPGSGSATSSAEPDSGDSDASPSEDSKDDKGHGLLHKAVFHGHREIVHWLIEKFPETTEVKDWVSCPEKC